jgi:hypothetical protein
MLTFTPKPPKPKVCKHCKTAFLPVKRLQVVCGPMCGLERARIKREAAAKKAERAADKVKREDQKTIPKLIKEAQVEFNAFIRERDKGLPCISCDAPWSAEPNTRDAGHYRSRGSASHLRFDEDNCHSQCKSCNQFGAGMVVQYRAGLIQRIGVARVEAIEANNETVKWGRDTLRQIKVIYRAKKRALLKKENA